MANITIRPLNMLIKTRGKETLREALVRNGIHIGSACNGQGICGNCIVWVVDDANLPRTPHESILEADSDEGCRLSCQLTPTRDIAMRLPMNFLHDAKRIRESLHILEGELPSTSRLVTAVQLQWKGGRYKMVYDTLPQKVALETWSNKFEPKGLAVDLGTTTLVVTLVSLETGKELATASRLNPQISFGHDVMTRIHHGSSREGLKELAQSLRKGVNTLIHEVCTASASYPEEILDMTVGGNTTMLQLLAGIDTAPLGHIPFKVDIHGGISYPVEQFGLEINKAARIYIPPVLHAFIGSDISSGLLIHGDFFNDEKSVLYIDIGTNGEIVLNLRGNRLACSAAAGPAFEGMGISCGMRASFGAVESVATDGCGLSFCTVGNVPMRGICGSGIVDLVATLLKMGIIDSTGRLRDTYKVKNPGKEVLAGLQERDGQKFYALGDQVDFTQQDIRQVQLAKGAIRAAIDILLTEAGSSVDELDSIVIAGGFGFFLNAENLEIIGLIPPKTKDKVVFAGNASRSGCVWLLLDISYRRFLEENIGRIRHVSIAQSPKFMEIYAQGMEFTDNTQ